MRAVFHHQLEALGEGLVALSVAVAESIEQSTTALLTSDLELAEKVIAADAAIDALQQEIDDQAVHMLAQQAPVATDLRTIVAAMRMSASMERMGDLARHVGLTIRRRFPDRVIPVEAVPLIKQMGDVTHDMALKLRTILENRDLDLASSLQADDAVLDGLHLQVFEILFAPEWAHGVAETVDVTLINRFYERMGDHACSVAERVTFLVTGEAEAGVHL
ncbi:phosphate signaling complex protein PhoU [Micrococcales bacterium 31B]|nr:phosphate signaling complex protein PhoU [Micrococcales bacterium 31B]